MNYKEIKEKWDKYTEGWFGTIIYLFLGFVIAYSFNLFLGLVLNTETPVVAVFSCSMEHHTNYDFFNQIFCPTLRSDEVCGKNINNYDTMNLDDYWKLCGGWYETQNISKNEFKSFASSDGLEVGDMIIVLNTENFKVGDIVIFDTEIRKYPIIHRVYSISGNTLMTKGDNNASPDSFTKTKIQGKAILKIPLLGWVKILFTKITGVA